MAVLTERVDAMGLRAEERHTEVLDDIQTLTATLKADVVRRHKLEDDDRDERRERQKAADTERATTKRWIQGLVGAIVTAILGGGGLAVWNQAEAPADTPTEISVTP